LAPETEEVRPCGIEVRGKLPANIIRKRPAGRADAKGRDMSTRIKDLLQTLTDGVEGFANAAKSIKDPELKTLFESFAKAA
jgi:hypothetical protein